MSKKKILAIVLSLVMVLSLVPQSVFAAAKAEAELGWENAGSDESATIHWGTIDGDTFTEFTDTATVDSSAGSISLDVIFDGYLYSTASYKKGDVEYAIDSKILKKEKAEDGSTYWTMQAHVVTGEEGSPETVIIEDGADIYVNYVEKSSGYTPPGPSPAEVKGPITEKTITDNEDGTYTIRLDITGQQDHTVNRVGANVIVILDRTQSMSNRMGNSTRMAAAREALQTLISTLDPGTAAEGKNLINFTVVGFANSANYSNELAWTQTRSEMLNYATTVDYLSGNAGLGTSWQAGLYGGIVRANDAATNNTLKGNKTYVIFVTDGNPNAWYTGTNSDGGPSNSPHFQQQGSGQFIQAAYTASIPNAINLSNLVGNRFYGVYCGGANDDGKAHLTDLMSATSNGSSVNGTFIDGTSEDAIKAAFKDIANTIVSDLGASNTVVDDGIPTLANVSSSVSGTAGGFKYYITPKNGTESEWEGAPSASYSSSNGVTWDLSAAGVLADGTKYSLEFTVWPSQAAYDKIADLNNGVITMTQAELDAAGIGGNKTDGYYLLTNTHLNTTYTYKDQTYSDSPATLPEEQMALPTETMKVTKEWITNNVDSRTIPDKITIQVTKDGTKYFEREITKAGGWVSDDLYISYGLMTVDSTGKITIIETGHEYAVIEPVFNDSHYWDIVSDTYRPMIVNGQKQLLKLVETADGSDYTIDGKYYKITPSEDAKLKATNTRRSALDLTKVVSTTDLPERLETALFGYEITITVPDEAMERQPNEKYVFFSVFDKDNNYIDMEDVDTSDNAILYEEDASHRYKYVESGDTFTIKIQKDWNVRFLNLALGTKIVVKELDAEMPAGFKFVKAEGTSAAVTEGDIVIDGQTATFTAVDSNLVYKITYTNEYEETDITATKIWVDNNNQDNGRPTASAFKDNIVLLADGKQYEAVPTITDNGDNTYKIEYKDLPKYINNKEVTYTVKETTVPGNYTVSPANAIADATSNYTITNTRKVGTLTISKTVVSDFDTDDNIGFVFNIETDPSINGEFDAEGTGAPQNGKVKFTGGKATVTLKHGQSIIIKGLATGVKFTITETVESGFTCDKQDGKVVINDLTENGAEAKFTNTRQTGNLKVSKTVVSNLTADTDVSFSFKIVLSDKTINGEISGVTFTNGETTIALKHGESKTITGLPAGITYTVTETVAENFSADATVKEGTIPANDTAEAAFINTKGTGDLKVTKTVESDLTADANVEFSFTVTLTGAADGTYGTGDAAVTFEGGKTTFTLKGGESKTITGLPIGAGYTVVETENSNFTTSKTGDTGTISTTLSETKFTNTRKTGDLEVTKTVESDLTADANVEFSFTVTLTGAADGTYGTGDAAVTFEGGKTTFTLKGGESKTITGLPTGAGYTVTEDAASGFTTTKTGDTGTISTEKSTAAFTNTRDTATLKIIKTYSGATLPETTKFVLTAPAVYEGETEFTFADFENGTLTLEKVPTGTYKVTEDAGSANVAGYTLVISGENATEKTLAKGEIVTFEITNTYAKDTAKLKVIKTAEGAAVPDDAEFIISGTPTAKDLTFADTKITYADIKDGNYVLVVPAGTYKVTETESTAAVAGYTLVVSGDNATDKDLAKDSEITFAIVNTYTKDMATLTLEKVLGKDSEQVTIPGGTKFTITGDTDSGEAWTKTVTYDELQKEGGNTFTVPTGKYSVTEDTATAAVAGYTLGTPGYSAAVTLGKGAKGGLIVTNTYTKDMATLKLTKTASGLAEGDAVPDDAKFVISAVGGKTLSGEEFKDVTVTYEDIKDGKWSLEVPVGKYTVTETGADVVGYTLETKYGADVELKKDGDEGTLTVTNTYTRTKIKITVTKVWVDKFYDKDDYFGLRPDSVKFTVTSSDGTTYEAELKGEGNTWTAEIEVPEYTNGKKNTFTVDEEKVTAGYVKKIDNDKLTITNTFAPCWGDPPVMKELKGDTPIKAETYVFKLTAVSNTAGLDKMPMPEDAKGAQEMTMEVTEVGKAKEFGKFDLSVPGTYTYTITEVAGSTEGFTYSSETHTIVYEVTANEETNALECVKKVDGVVIEGDETDEANVSKFTITNTYTTPVVEVKVTKVWDDADDEGGSRPATVTVHLLADGKDTGKTLVLGETTKWEGTFEKLDKYGSDGKAITYTVKEDVPKDYIGEVTGDMTKGFVITNTADVPDTGDHNDIFLWSGVMAVSLLGVVFLAIRRRKEEQYR